MSVTPTYPGVYIQEVSSGVRTITGVSTAVTAFIGYTARGPLDTPVQIFDFGSFEREFGGLSSDSEIGYAVKQYFLNGGSEAWVIRVAENTETASVSLACVKATAASAIPVLQVRAKSPGSWGNYLRLDVDYNTTNPNSTFNLNVSSYALQADGQLALSRSESFRNLSMNSQSSIYAPSVVNAGSQLIQLSRDPGATGAMVPGGSGTPVYSVNGLELSNATIAATLGDRRNIAIVIDGDGPYIIPVWDGSGGLTLSTLAGNIEAAVRGLNPAWNDFQADIVGADDTSIQTTTGYLKLHFNPPRTIAETHAIEVRSASTLDASQVLKFGVANGGREYTAAAAMRPAQTGSTSLEVTPGILSQIAGSSGALFKMKVTLDPGSGSLQNGTEFDLPAASYGLGDLASSLESLIRSNSGGSSILANVSVGVIGRYLRFSAPSAPADAQLLFSSTVPEQSLATLLGLGTGSNINVQRYSVGSGKAWGAQKSPVPGRDGNAPTTGAPFISGSTATRTGLYALEGVDLFNILCVPRTAEWASNTETLAVITAAAAYCESRRAFYLIDPPNSVNTVESMKSFMSSLSTALSRNAAVYFPAVRIPDPLNGYRLRSIGPSGSLAGVYARTDSTRGVWKAPAGTEANLVNAQALAYNLTDAENGVLNPLGINCIRVLPSYGRVAWGSRTLKGSDQQADEYKYVPVRRLALFIEESLYRGLQWVVFEPNDEPLWSQIRLNAGAFMHNLFRQGAFQGTSPSQAYFVKCDRETTTQNDINQGIVNIEIGFAPLKPAEFVVIKLQQIAGQIAV